MKYFDRVYFLGFEVVRYVDGGYGIAPHDAKGRGDLLGDLRMEAAVAMWKAGKVGRIIVLGMIQLSGSHPLAVGADSAEGIRWMLVNNYGVDPASVEAHKNDTETTRGNAQAVRDIEHNDGSGTSCVLTNLFHVPRTEAHLSVEGVGHVPTLAAEAVLLQLSPTEDVTSVVEQLSRRFAGADLVSLMVGEARGLAASQAGRRI